MLARRALTHLKISPSLQFSSATKPVEEGKSNLVRKAVSFVFITVTGGIALSALDDLAIYHACSSKAMEKVNKNQAIRDALGEPVEKGPWYSASLAVAQKRHSVSCTFPVSGPQGNGILQLKAVRNSDESWLSYLRPRGWEILIMEALVHVPENEEKTRTFRITLSENLLPPPPASPPCTACTDGSSKEASPADK